MLGPSGLQFLHNLFIPPRSAKTGKLSAKTLYFLLQEGQESLLDQHLGYIFTIYALLRTSLYKV